MLSSAVDSHPTEIQRFGVIVPSHSSWHAIRLTFFIRCPSVVFITCLALCLVRTQWLSHSVPVCRKSYTPHTEFPRRRKNATASHQRQLKQVEASTSILMCLYYYSLLSVFGVFFYFYFSHLSYSFFYSFVRSFSLLSSLSYCAVQYNTRHTTRCSSTLVVWFGLVGFFCFRCFSMLLFLHCAFLRRVNHLALAHRLMPFTECVNTNTFAHTSYRSILFHSQVLFD